MIKMTIEVSPEQAIEVAKLLSIAHRQPTPTAQPTQVAQPANSVPITYAAPVAPPIAHPVSASAIPTVAPSATVPAAPQAQNVPTATPQLPTAPPTAARKYTMDELALASRPICEAGRQAELLNLLHSFTYTDAAGNVQQVQSIQQLPESLYPNFANGIRSLGGKI